MVKDSYWEVSDAQVVEKTGRPLAYWRAVLEAFGAARKASNLSVAHLQREHGVPRYWARTLVTNFLKSLN